MEKTNTQRLTEALAGNVAVHGMVALMRSGDPDRRVRAASEIGKTLAVRHGTLPLRPNGLRSLVALPPLATAILPL